jgi:hypothetical protein
MEKISRETAVQLGLKRYFTGVPCIHGHISERYVASNECVECNRLTQQKQKERDPERVRLWSRLSKQKQRARDPERVRQQWREWYARQKAKENQESRELKMETARSVRS